MKENIITRYIEDVGVLRTVEQVENLCKGKKKGTTLKAILKHQVLF